MYKYLVILISVLFFTCAGTQKQTKTVEKENQRKAKQKQLFENFDPSSLGEYKPEQWEQRSGSESFDLEKFLSQGSETALIKDKVSGYRVQLIATRDESEARSIRNEALLSFEENVYLTYDDPYYKVRIGDCVSRFSAEKLQEKAIEKRFVDAWVVRTMIAPESGVDDQDKEQLDSVE